VGFEDAECSKCGVKGHSKKGKPHRRCSGKKGGAIRTKHDPIAGADKGTWAFTLIEVLIVVAILGIGVAMAIPMFSGATGIDAGVANEGARNWATSMGYENAAVNCVQQDTDGDGYVSCTVRDKATDKLIPIECAAAFNLNSGCRIPKLGVPRQRL
jgi:prepilin-type N-terminal cleavage/methylation domain-containing protein